MENGEIVSQVPKNDNVRGAGEYSIVMELYANDGKEGTGMTLNETVDMLKSLKLNGMAESYNEMMNLPINMRPSLEQAMARMIEAEKMPS